MVVGRKKRQRKDCRLYTWDQGQRPPERTWDQAAKQEMTSYIDPHGGTDTCENITLPQTSFAGDNYAVFKL